ncbi:25445_t:CDS:2, partial [Racocetra persica]
LENNQDIELKTAPEYVIGYLVEKLRNKDLLKSRDKEIVRLIGKRSNGVSLRTKNNIPPVVEEQIICQEQETLTKQQVIPQDFVELTTRGKNYMCSTEELMEKLGLESGKNCSELIFISPEVLKRETECGGVALKNEKEIFLAPQKSKLFREKG